MLLKTGQLCYYMDFIVKITLLNTWQLLNTDFNVQIMLLNTGQLLYMDLFWQVLMVGMTNDHFGWLLVDIWQWYILWR